MTGSSADATGRSPVAHGRRGYDAAIGSALHWSQASIEWAPEFTRDTFILRVPASLRGHAREILIQTLPPALERLSGVATDSLVRIDVQPSREVAYDDGSTGVEQGEVTIIAERLTEIFEPGELRQRLDALAVEAVTEGDR